MREVVKNGILFIGAEIILHTMGGMKNGKNNQE